MMEPRDLDQAVLSATPPPPPKNACTHRHKYAKLQLIYGLRLQEVEAYYKFL